MQFTEKRLRVKWYGSRCGLADKASTFFRWARHRQRPSAPTWEYSGCTPPGPYGTKQRRGCHAILTTVGCCKAQQVS